jgi:hypothetical protein
MRISIIGLIIISSLLFMGATCERPVELSLGNPSPQLVISSDFTAGQNVLVTVTETQNILESPAIKFVDDATVEVFQEDELLETLTFIPQTNRLPPKYVSNQFKPQEGETYILKASAPGFDPIMAQSHVPYPVEISQLFVSNVDLTVNSDAQNDMTYSYNVQLQFEDPADMVNYYHLNFLQKVFSFTVLEGDTIIISSSLEPVSFSPQNNKNTFIAYFLGGVLFEDTEFNGDLITASFNISISIDSEAQLLGPMVAQLRNVSEHYYHYYNSVSRQQTSGNDPFSPPVFIDSNVENGKGVFAGYNQSTDSTLVIN